MDIFSLKHMKWASPSNTAYSIPGTKIHFKQEILNFGPKLPSKGFSGLKKKKWASSLILHIRISLGAKVHLKLIILDYCSKYTPKGVLPV